MTTINNIDAVEKSFFRSLGNGKQALADAVTMIKSVVDSRDTTVLARAMQRAKDEKGDDKAVAALKLMIVSVWPGAKAGATKKGDMSIRIKGVKADPAIVETLDTLVADGVSLRGTILSKTLKKADDTAFDVAKWAARQHKAHPDQLDAMIAALQALRSQA